MTTKDRVAAMKRTYVILYNPEAFNKKWMFFLFFFTMLPQ